MLDEVAGFGPIEPLLADHSINEVMVNGPRRIYVERAGKIERVDVTFRDDEHVLNIIDRIITPLGRHIDETSPRVDARLPDGSRVNAIIKPLSLVGPVITVRKFAVRYSVDDLVRFGTATAEMFDFLRACVEARLNIFLSGGTGSGQDDDAQRPLLLHPRRRAHRHDRGRGRAAAQPDARHPARGPTLEPRGPRRDQPSATCCAMRCTCGPTASSSASAAPARRST